MFKEHLKNLACIVEISSDLATQISNPQILKKIAFVLVDFGMKVAYIQIAVERAALAVRWNQVFRSAAFFPCISCI